MPESPSHPLPPSSRSPVLWATWQGALYSLRGDGERVYDVDAAHVVSLRRDGATVTCYGGPLDHLRPTALFGEYSGA